MTQTQLANKVGVTQGTIASLISGRSSGSKHLHKIAKALRTTPAYLTGEIDDPDEAALPAQPEPRSQGLMMRVEFPSENALAAMFEAQLQAYASLEGAALARALAKRLPKAIARLQEVPLYEETASPAEDSEGGELPASDHSEPQQAQRR